MNAYLIAAITVAGLVAVILATYQMFFRKGVSQGKTTAEAEQAARDLIRQREADAVVNTEVPKEDVQKALRDGTF